ncbi:MAG TPA: hypothetical protein VIV11_42360 [Kofleriaceae bacterium]
MEQIELAELNLVRGGYGPAADPSHQKADMRSDYKMAVEQSRGPTGPTGYPQIQVLPAPGGGR